MRRLFAKIMLIIACSVVMLHAMVPHHHMSCGMDGLYVVAPHTHYGMCDSDDDCYEVNCIGRFGMSAVEHHHSGSEQGSVPDGQCKIQELLTQSLINSNEHDIYTVLENETVLDLLYGELNQELLVAFIPITTCDWGEYVEFLPTQGLPSDAPLRAPPIC